MGSLPPSLRLMLIPTTTEATLVATMVATLVATGPTVLDTATTTARGRLRLSPRLMLTTVMADMALATGLTDSDTVMVSDMATTTARGRLSLLWSILCSSRCCPCCELRPSCRRCPCLYRRPRCPHPCRLQLRSGLPLCLPLHRRHCPRCHPRRRRSLRWCRTLRCQLCRNRPCCQEGG